MSFDVRHLHPPPAIRHDLRARKSRTKIHQIDVAALKSSAKPPSPTAVLRHWGITTYATFELGSGQFSKVYKAYNGGREVAVKVIKLDLISADVKKRFIPREKELWPKIRHRNICELFQCVTCDRYGYLFMIMEYCHNGDLLSFLQRNGSLSEEIGRRWLRALLDAINYLHRMKIAHRDIKAENVLISRRYTVKLTDFGFVCQHSDDHYSRTYCGSRAYSSPEVLKGVPYDVFKNDVWSFGVLCFVSMTSTMPFREQDNTNAGIVAQQLRQAYRWPRFVRPEYRHSINAMLAFNQEKRPTAKDLKKLPFFVRTSEEKKSSSSNNNLVGAVAKC